jgi:putative FmdB family regulatory protein
MPIYEYRCESCGFQKEYLKKFGDANKTSCPQCGSVNFNKLLSAAGFQLKGSGWYATDFKDKRKTDKKDPEDSKPAAEVEKKTTTECGGGACPACQ